MGCSWLVQYTLKSDNFKEPKRIYMFREPYYLSTDPNPRIFICSGNLIIYPLILILKYSYV